MGKINLRPYAAALAAAEHRAFVRRVMWIDFEERFRRITDEIRAERKLIDQFGGAYCDRSSKRVADCDAFEVNRANSLNWAELRLGLRPLHLFHNLGGKQKGGMRSAFDKGAKVVFSQDVAGHVYVTFFPFRSDLVLPQDDYLVVFRGESPLALDESRVRKLLRDFFRYALATSSSRIGSTADAVFIWRLWARNLLFASAKRAALIHALERVFLVVAPILAIWLGFLGLK